MLRAIGYMLQVGALVLLVGWLLAQGGRFDVLLGDYRVQGDTPLLLIILLQ